MTAPDRLDRAAVHDWIRTIEEDECCVDILTQLSSVTSALRAVGLGLLDEHCHNCVNDGTQSDEAVRAHMIAEAVDATERSLKT